jgi:hypothetical protein
MDEKYSADITIGPMDEYMSALDDYSFNTEDITISGGGLDTSTLGNITIGGYPYGSSTINSTSWDSSIDAENITWQGRSLGDMLSKIEKRLSILTPDPKKLEHFEALQKAYEHYKTLEALCELPEEEDNDIQ